MGEADHEGRSECPGTQGCGPMEGMPWCESCERYWSPASLDDGNCPECHEPAVSGALVETVEADEGTEEEHRPEPIDTTIPWHFYVVLVAAFGYLAWRALQGLGLLF